MATSTSSEGAIAPPQQLSHAHDCAISLKADLVHQCLHEEESAPMRQQQVGLVRWIRYRTTIKALPLVPHCDQDFAPCCNGK
jgi:hypothetical protein